MYSSNDQQDRDKDAKKQRHAAIEVRGAGAFFQESPCKRTISRRLLPLFRCTRASGDGA